MIETIVAMVVLGGVLLITITVISSAFTTLGGAKETDVANNIGQARIEAARSLPFTDVGTVNGSPGGTIVASEALEIQGVDLQVDTTVQWVGSATGLDILNGAQTGDGVPGFFDPGIDYKLVTVTVTPNVDGDPIVFETIIAPPNVAASEGAANLIVRIDKDEPSFAPSDPSLPRVYLHPATGFLAGDIGLEEVPFLDIDDGVEHAIRLGPALADTTDGTWAMSDPTLASTVGAATTSTASLSIYRPITLEVTATDDVGVVLPDATLVVTDVATSDTLTLGPADMVSPGVWQITELVPGVPLKHGDYSYVVSAPGFPTDGTLSVAAPQGYPLDVVERSTVPLVPATSTSVTVNVADALGTPLTNVSVLVTPEVGGAFDVLTDANGSVVLELDNDEAHDIIVTSAYGHEAVTISAVEGDEVPGDVLDVTLPTPTDAALFTLNHSSGTSFAGKYEYRPVTSTGDDWLFAEENASGSISVVVTTHTEDGTRSRWEARVACDDGSFGNVQRRRFSAPIQDRDRTFNDAC